MIEHSTFGHEGTLRKTDLFFQDTETLLLPPLFLGSVV